MKQACMTLVFALGVALGGCGDDSSSGNCLNAAGTYTITQHCEASFVGDTVTVMQNGCSITTGAPFDGFEGTVGATGQFNIGGTVSGTVITCAGTISATQITQNCQPDDCGVLLTKN